MQKVCRNLSLSQFADRLRDIGFSIGLDKLKAAISAGYFGAAIVAISMSNTEYIIPERAVNEWIDRNAIEVEASPEVQRIADIYERGQTA